jgi:hypothetical protein
MLDFVDGNLNCRSIDGIAELAIPFTAKVNDFFKKKLFNLNDHTFTAIGAVSWS